MNGAVLEAAVHLLSLSLCADVPLVSCKPRRVGACSSRAAEPARPIDSRCARVPTASCEGARARWSVPGQAH